MRRSVGIPLALGIGIAILVVLLAIGWQILVLDDPRALTQGLSTRDWLMLILGTLFFALVLAGLVALSAWLVREMRLNQRQRAFLDAVTHEMRTPLASLRLYLDTLRRHDPAPEQRRAFLPRGGRCAAHGRGARARLVQRAQPRAQAGRARGRAQRGVGRREPLRRHAARGGDARGRARRPTRESADAQRAEGERRRTPAR